jgi:hypothetical protein
MAKCAQSTLFFYCYACNDYEPKTSSHYAVQQSRFAAGREAEKTNPQQPKKRKKG